MNSPVYQKLPDEEYKKLLSTTRRAVSEALHPLRMYGQGDFVDGATEEIMDIIEQALMAVRGKKIPIRLRKYVNPRG